MALVSRAGLQRVRDRLVNHSEDSVLLEYETALRVSRHDIRELRFLVHL